MRQFIESPSIVKYPSAILRAKAEPVTEFDSTLVEIVKIMLHLMAEHNGIGLAAPQIGLSKSLIVVKPPDKEHLVFANVEIVRRGLRTKKMNEGCLSLPGINGDVERPHRFEFVAQDVEGNKKQHYYEGITGRIIQHEVDHLNGILIIDHFSEKDLEKAKPILEALEHVHPN